MNKELIPEQLSLDEQIDNKLVKGNVTEAVIADLRERYLPLKIAGIEDKETYLLVKEGRKNCKAIRVMAKKICTDGREDAVAIQKKWVAKEKEVTSRIAEVEDYLEEQEKAYEAEVAAEKEARKRKQEEQLIMRQQKLTSMGVLYSGGTFILGDVSFDLAAIKESDEDVWLTSILPRYEIEYGYIEAERIEQDRLNAEKEAELKRQQEELEKKEKELAEKELRIAREADRQAAEAKRKKSEQFEFRSQQLEAIGFHKDGIEWYVFKDFKIDMGAIWNWEENAWSLQLISAKQYVDKVSEEEAEEKRKEQERQELQKIRYEQLYPYAKYGGEVEMDKLWAFHEDTYMEIFEGKKAAFQKAEEERIAAIKEAAVKKERERIEEEQRQAEIKRREDLRKSRIAVLNEHCLTYFNENGHLENMTEDEWLKVFRKLVDERDGIIRKQEEERKAEELAQASEKVKWKHLVDVLSALQIPKFVSGQYAKKAAILREKLEEIKSL